MTAPVEVEFSADGIALAGHLRRPQGAGQLPGLVFTGPFTGVKEQVTGHYAALLAERGFVTLVFDHRNFGVSGGTVRQHEDSAGKLADLSAATSFLSGHEAVDAQRVGCVGICLGGGYAMRHSAFDPRIKALAVVAAAFNDPRVMRAGIGEAEYRAMLGRFADVAARQNAGGEVEYVPAVSARDEEAAMPGREPWDYYGTERSAGGAWENRVTRLSVRELLTVDLAIGAEFIAPTPALIVHGRTDDYCPPSGAQSAYDRIAGPKELMWLDTTNHIDLYDQPDFVVPAVERVAAWMHEHLG